MSKSMKQQYPALYESIFGDNKNLDLATSLHALIAPILARTEGQIGTHSDRCYEYHVGCLAVAVEGLLKEDE